jgi:hypothetical protein
MKPVGGFIYRTADGAYHTVGEHHGHDGADAHTGDGYVEAGDHRGNGHDDHAGEGNGAGRDGDGDGAREEDGDRHGDVEEPVVGSSSGEGGASSAGSSPPAPGDTG